MLVQNRLMWKMGVLAYTKILKIERWLKYKRWNNKTLRGQLRQSQIFLIFMENNRIYQSRGGRRFSSVVESYAWRHGFNTQQSKTRGHPMYTELCFLNVHTNPTWSIGLMPYQNSNDILQRIRKIHMETHTCIHTHTQIAKEILSKTRGVILLGFKVNYKAIETKAAWWWHKKKTYRPTTQRA